VHNNKEMKGQATFEYLFVIAMILVIGLFVFKQFNTAIRVLSSGLAGQLSIALSSGVCEKNCFFKKYHNAIE